MRYKNTYITFFFFLLLCNSLHSQTNINEDKNKYSNQVMRFEFFRQGNYYPLTVVICPYGFWFAGEIYLGYKNYKISEHLKNMTFCWNINGLMVETPKIYSYDTITADTMSSMFNTFMCLSNSPNLPLKTSNNDQLINISDSNSYAGLLKEFQYSYILKNITFDSVNESIRIVYPTTNSPYKTSFDLVTLELLHDSIKITSTSINTINLLNIKVKENGYVFLKTKDYKRLIKRVRKTTFKVQVDCHKCNQEPYEQFDFIVDYKNIQLQYSHFLCEGLKGNSKDQKEIIDNLLGLKHVITSLNEKYFY